jgi:hypothetical protein
VVGKGRYRETVGLGGRKLGDCSEGARAVPIPNTEVKRLNPRIQTGAARASVWESRGRAIKNKRKAPVNSRGFLLPEEIIHKLECRSRFEELFFLERRAGGNDSGNMRRLKRELSRLGRRAFGGGGESGCILRTS